jgi:serine/threonine protein kinase/Flp pilus assembly protein TadD
MLTAGSNVSHYKILDSIGAGGMGEIYRAVDTKLDRTVAIKALPSAFRGHADRLKRFEREAKILASLNHPNIAAIYGLEEMDGAPYLVLEFVRGESLAQRLGRGPLEVREALEVGEQVASAIEAAHDRGIVHRDLKPGNVMITQARVAKVLDFGLAKGTEADDGPAPGMSSAPTLARSATADGLVLGTAPYMSPEQARGKEVDRRTDVWAFGCLLFESLTGRQTFAGDTVSDVIAHILERDPEWDSLPASAPPRLRDVIRRCLTKDPDERPRDIGDLRRELHSILLEISSLGRAAATKSSSVPSLAVLYFENLSKDPDSEYFCAGITEDILTDLSKIKGLRVASRNAVTRYRGAPVDIPRVAAELGVRTVLEGTVRRAGDRVRISAQLINASDGFHLWAERYDRTLADVFAVQEEIAHSIAEALRVTLSPKEAEALAQDKPRDARAYDLYLKGRQRYGVYSQESLNEALELFRQATEIDPNYALAWAGIADCYGQFMQWGDPKRAEENERLGVEAARRAISLNPKLAEGYKALALVLRQSGDFDEAKSALRQAIQVNPRFTPALINLAVHEYSHANVAGAERYVRRALDADPQEAFGTLWLTVLMIDTGRPNEALSALARLHALQGNTFYVTAHANLLAMTHLHRGDLDQAQQALDGGRAAGATLPNLRAVEALIHARRGMRAEAKRTLLELKDAQGIGAGGLSCLAEAAILIGEPDLDLPYMDRPLMGDLGPIAIRLTPALHGLLDRAPFAPRRSDKVLVWPIEAPMMDPSILPLFREIRIDSGLPQLSEVRSSAP